MLAMNRTFRSTLHRTLQKEQLHNNTFSFDFKLWMKRVRLQFYNFFIINIGFFALSLSAAIVSLFRHVLMCSESFKCKKKRSMVYNRKWLCLRILHHRTSSSSILANEERTATCSNFFFHKQTLELSLTPLKCFVNHSLQSSYLQWKWFGCTFTGFLFEINTKSNNCNYYEMVFRCS